jgi:hypothetical protein
MTTTYCSDCDHVHSDTRKEAPWRWRCMAVPIEERGYGYVSPDYAPSPPYDLCNRVNRDGTCPMFTPRRTAPEKPTKETSNAA